MTNIREKFNKKIINLFGDNDFYNNIIQYNYLDEILKLNDNIEIDDIIKFIIKYEKNFINNWLQNERLKDILLTENDIVYRTKETIITKDYFSNILNNIKNNKFDKNSIIIILEVIKYINLYGLNNDSFTADILDNNINNIVDNVNLVSDGDRIITNLEKINKTNILLKWYKRFNNNILSQIFNLELLKNRLEGLLNSDKINVSAYSDKLIDLINTCDKAIELRDNNIQLSFEEFKKINKLFIDYESINHNILIEYLNCNDYQLIHFVQSDEVNYQSVGDKVIDVNKHKENEEQGYNKKQNNVFISSYVDYIKKKIEKIKCERFDINNEGHRKMLHYYLDLFNNTFNNNPLYRFPIEISEVGQSLVNYIRLSDNRLSCSLNFKDYTNSHLGRNVGLIIRPMDEKSIISMSYGYTSKKYFYDFRNDSVTCNSLINRLLSNSRNVSEVVLDASKCIVEGVVLIGDNENDIMRATKLAASYGVPIIKYDNTKIR